MTCHIPLASRMNRNSLHEGTSFLYNSPINYLFFQIQRSTYDRPSTFVYFPRKARHFETKLEFACHSFNILNNMQLIMVGIGVFCLTYMFIFSFIFLSRDGIKEKAFGHWFDFGWHRPLIFVPLDIFSLSLLIQLFLNVFQPHV